MCGPQSILPQLSIDTGGTFTDAVLRSADGSQRVAKVLSSSSLRARVVRIDGPRTLTIDAPASLGSLGALGAEFVIGWQLEDAGLRGTILAASMAAVRDSASLTGMALRLEASTDGVPFASGEPLHRGACVDLVAPWPAPILATRLLLACPASRSLPPLAMRLGTTRGTNALLERRLDAVLLVTNEGLADALAIGDQRRDRLFAPAPRDRPRLHRAAIETTLRQDASGTVIRELDETALRASLERARAEFGTTHGAVLLMHAWRNPEPERRIAELLRRAGMRRVVASHECTGTEGYLERGLATVVDAALSSAVGDFIDSVRRELSTDSTLEIATSAASLRPDLGFPPRESILSGPSGGAAAVLQAMAELREGTPASEYEAADARTPSVDLDAALGFDMGGTSTDAIRVTDRLPRREHTTIGDWTFATPSLSIESVAAGGGSICRFEHGVLRVGPESAGSVPGPACYGRGGPLTVTDVDLLLGRGDPTRFAVPIDLAAARTALDEIVRAQRVAGIDRDTTQTLDALRAIADEAMAAALSTISAREGFDPAQHSLVCFGGAGGQHACAIADRLGIRSIVHPGGAGVLSAAGMSLLRRERIRSEGVHRPLSVSALRTAHDSAMRTLAAEPPPVAGAVLALRSAEAAIGWRGQPAVVEIDAPSALLSGAEPDPHDGDADSALIRTACDRYRAVFGAEAPQSLPELSFVRVVAEWRAARASSPKWDAPSPVRAASGRDSPPQRMRSHDRWVDASLVDRSRLAVGDRVDGPAIVADDTATLVIDSGWSGRVDAMHAVQVQRGTATAFQRCAREPEVLASALASIAVEMGEQLRRTAVSVNVRDRLDYSCGILHPAGRLATTAPHVPVHLGALGECVRSLISMRPMRSDELFVTNAPCAGGSHLPDVTVVMAVGEPRARPVAFVAARAHHAEIGGCRPGSMPPSARTLVQEGVVIPPTPIGSIDAVDFTEVARLLREAPYPSRAIEDNLADLGAAVAALRRGSELIHSFVRENGAESLRRTLDDLRRRSRNRMVESIAKLAEFDRTVEQRLDDGALIRVRVQRRGERLIVDFTGSGDVHPGNLNAPHAVVRSAVMYALRVLVESHEPLDDRLLPLNDGLLDPVDLVIPRGLLDPPPSAPVAAGNTETSQRIVDALLLALGVAACSQGTMNNLAMGGVLADGRTWSFYETIAGGCGATFEADGASGLHSHMTNTRITDPETLERRVPLRLVRFGYRRGSGGHSPAQERERVSAAADPASHHLHHGGDGLVREFEFLSAAEVSFIAQRRMTGPDGLGDGASGCPGAQWLVHAGSATAEALPGIAEFDAAPGDRLRIETPGGGAAA